MYTLTLNHTDDDGNLNGQSDVYTGLTLAEVKSIAKRNCGSAATWTREKTVKVVAQPLKSFYRGNEIEFIEARQNGWSLVSNTDGSRYFYLAVTREIEYR